MHFLRHIKFLLVVVLALFYIAPAQALTLDGVKQRGYLICGANQPLAGFSQRSAEGLWSGFDVDICRAISAAIFGDPEKVEFRALLGQTRIASLQTGDVDVMVRNGAWTMRKDVSYKMRFVATSFFDGQSFLVRQSLNVVSAYELDRISVCVISDSDSQKNMSDFFFENQIEYQEILFEDSADLSIAFKNNLCDAVTAPASFLYSIMLALPDPAQLRILPERISKEPLGPVVRNNDDEWFNIIRWVLFVLLNAEELGVNSLSVASMQDTNNPAIRRLLGLEGDFGEAMGLDKDWAKNIITNVGNYREIYERSFGSQTGVALPRGANALWINGGLLFAPPIR